MAIYRVRATIDPPPAKDSLAEISQEVPLTQSVDKTLVSPSLSPFLVVLTESDFDLIVDEIWANMKKDKKGWNTKAQLRAGLLAFMQSLPGN